MKILVAKSLNNAVSKSFKYAKDKDVVLFSPGCASKDWFKNFEDRITYIPKILANSRLHDDCITVNQREIIAIEGMKLLSKHDLEIPAKWAISYFDDLLRDELETIDIQNSIVLKTAKKILDNDQKKILAQYLEAKNTYKLQEQALKKPETIQIMEQE